MIPLNLTKGKCRHNGVCRPYLSEVPILRVVKPGISLIEKDFCFDEPTYIFKEKTDLDYNHETAYFYLCQNSLDVGVNIVQYLEVFFE